MARRNRDEKDPEEVIAWLKAQLELKSQRQLARELGIYQSIVSRNVKGLREGKSLAAPFRKTIERAMEKERADELHQQCLKDQAEAANLKRQELLAA